MKEFVLFGLGNPGEAFRHTRHNLGADVVVSLIEYMRTLGASVSSFKAHEKFHAQVCEIVYADTRVTILSPLVFMNESGKVLASYLRYHPVEREHILVIHDDLEVPLGEVKFQEKGSAHGHNGVRSIHEYLGDMDVPQLRIGIGRPVDATPIDKFVLASFSPQEKEVLREKESEAIIAITQYVFPDKKN